MDKNTNQLIKAEIKEKHVIYHLVTKEDLINLRNIGILNSFFMLLVPFLLEFLFQPIFL